jgi:hypothetical protein
MQLTSCNTQMLCSTKTAIKYRYSISKVWKQHCITLMSKGNAPSLMMVARQASWQARFTRTPTACASTYVVIYVSKTCVRTQ